jgi:drug/metabolite transporter (DMT)-like permease
MYVVAFAVAITLSLITVYADYLIKKASLLTAFNGSFLLLSGMMLYGLTGLGWFFVMRQVKLSTLGVIYGVTCIIALTLISVFVFKERLHFFEVVGIICALVSLVLLARFA